MTPKTPKPFTSNKDISCDTTLPHAPKSDCFPPSGYSTLQTGRNWQLTCNGYVHDTTAKQQKSAYLASTGSIATRYRLQDPGFSYTNHTRPPRRGSFFHIYPNPIPYRGRAAGMTDFEDKVNALAEFLRFGPPGLKSRDSYWVAWMFAGHWPEEDTVGLIRKYMFQQFRGGRT